MSLAPAAIVISRDLWGRRFEVSAEPPSAAYPLRIYRSHDEALGRAEEIHDATGWPIIDRGAAVGAQ